MSLAVFRDRARPLALQGTSSMRTNVDTINSRASARSCDPEIDRLLHPGRFYERPADVVMDASLTHSERRAILSAWASDACAVDSAPPLRHPPFASQPVSFDEVMDALVALDQLASQSPTEIGRCTQRRAPRKQGIEVTAKRAAAPMAVAGMD